MERVQGHGSAGAQETPLHDDGKNCTREPGCCPHSGCWGGQGVWEDLGRDGAGGCWCPQRRFGGQGQLGGSRWGSGCIPNAPDYLSISPLGTRTGSEHGGRPGRPNWRPSQTVKRGECRGSTWGGRGGGGGDWHCTAQHVTVPAATLRGTQPRILPAGAHTGSGIGAPGLGGSQCRFQQHVPGSH